jgi:hypothetical protein
MSVFVCACFLVGNQVHFSTFLPTNNHQPPRPSQRKHYPPRRRLLFHILPGMPRLSISTDQLPSHLFSGELIRIPITIHNIGRLPARNLKLAVEEAAGVAVAGGGAGVGAGAASLMVGAGASDTLEPSAHRRNDGRNTLLFDLPATAAAAAAGSSGDDGELLPGQSVQVALWLHAPVAPGAWEFKCVWYCEPVVSLDMGMFCANAGRIFRHLCLSTWFQNLPDSSCIYPHPPIHFSTIQPGVRPAPNALPQPPYRPHRHRCAAPGRVTQRYSIRQRPAAVHDAAGCGL